MVRLLIIVMLILTGLVLGPVLLHNQGTVHIDVGEYSLHTRLNVFIVALVLLFIALYFCIAIIKRTTRSLIRAKNLFSHARVNRAIKKTDLAQHHLLEGDYQQAEKLLTHNAASSKYPVFHLLQAAEAAQLNGDKLKANQLLKQADTACNDKDRFTFEIVRTRIQLGNKETEAAKASIERLLKQKPRHPEVLRLAEKTYLLIEDYQTLIELLPTMYKVHIRSDIELDELKQMIYQRQIRKLSHSGRHALRTYWIKQPKTVRDNPVLQACVAKQLLYLGDHEYVQQMVMKALKQQFNPQLLVLLPAIESITTGKLKKMISKLLKSHASHLPSNKALIYRTLAQLALKEQNQHEALSYLEKAIGSHPTEEELALLNKLKTDMAPVIESQQ